MNRVHLHRFMPWMTWGCLLCGVCTCSVGVWFDVSISIIYDLNFSCFHDVLPETPILFHLVIINTLLIGSLLEQWFQDVTHRRSPFWGFWEQIILHGNGDRREIKSDKIPQHISTSSNNSDSTTQLAGGYLSDTICYWALYDNQYTTHPSRDPIAALPFLLCCRGDEC